MSTAPRPSPGRARWVWGVPIVLALVLLVALGIVLAHSEPRLTGTNSVPLRGPAVGLQEGEQMCQLGQLMPEDSGRMRMFLAPARADRTPEVLVTIRQKQDGLIARTAGHYRRPGVLDVTIDPPVRRTRIDAEVCVRNTGRATVVLSGILTPFGDVMLRGKRLDAALTTLWYETDKTSWLSELPAVIPRVGHARIGGTWAFWIASLLLLSALGVALTTAIRENTR
jgi:hypothetical protein